MTKTAETKTYEVTYVFDITSDPEKPISKSMLGKIRKQVDLVDVFGDTHIRVTTNRHKFRTSGNPIDSVNRVTEMEEGSLASLLRSCSHSLRINKIQTFIFG